MENLVSKFQRIKARVKFGEVTATHHGDHSAVRLNVARDKKGTFFEVLARRDVQIEILEVRPEIRHLLLMAKIPMPNPDSLTKSTNTSVEQTKGTGSSLPSPRLHAFPACGRPWRRSSRPWFGRNRSGRG